MKNGVFITRNKYQTTLRLSVFSIVSYLLWTSGIAIYGFFPLEASTTVLGLEFKEPHILISLVRLIVAVVAVLAITVVPILFAWAKIEDKFFTEE